MVQWGVVVAVRVATILAVISTRAHMAGSATAGDAPNPKIGTVVMVGDESLDSAGPTLGMVEKTLACLLDTIVVNNAASGNSLTDAYWSSACSFQSTCLWSIIIASETADDTVTMQQFVDREIRSGKKVIIHGPVPGKMDAVAFAAYQAMMDMYQKITTVAQTLDRKPVYLIDPRKWPSVGGHYAYAAPATMAYFSPDQSTGSPHMAVEMAKAIADVITRNLARVDKNHALGAVPECVAAIIPSDYYSAPRITLPANPCSFPVPTYQSGQPINITEWAALLAKMNGQSIRYACFRA